jgi:RNA polymerase sigma factor (sigma-70 family)
MRLFGNSKNKFRQYTDQELIACFVKEQCEHTIPILYERYAHLVMGSCMKYLKHVENAEDVTMRIFAELGTKLTHHSVQHFKSWLYQVTKNECLQFLRKNKPNQTVLIEQLTCDYEIGLETYYEKELVLTQLEKAIQELKPEQQMCIRLFYLEQKSYQEVSDQLKLSLNTVKSAIQNGKRNIKIWMDRHENH